MAAHRQDENVSEADLIARLGLQTWMDAREFLPEAGSACAVVPDRNAVTIFIPSTNE